MKRRRKKLGLSTTKWSNADYECGCGRCCPMRQTPDAKLMDRRSLTTPRHMKTNRTTVRLREKKGFHEWLTRRSIR